MSKLKAVLGTVLFVAMGMIVYSFANPEADSTIKKEPEKTIEQTEKTGNETEKKDNNENVVEEEVVIRNPNRNNNIDTTPEVVAVNYDLLEAAVNIGNEALKIETDETELQGLLEQLREKNNDGSVILDNRSGDQESVDNQVIIINNIITNINNYINQQLATTLSNGNNLLSNYDESQPTNEELIGLLNDLNNLMSPNQLNNSSDFQPRIMRTIMIRQMLAQINSKQEDLNVIDGATITLTPSKTTFTNEDISLSLDIVITNPLLINKTLINKGNECVDKESVNTITATENGNYIACVYFNNGEIRTVNYEVTNIDKEAPVAQIIISSKTKNGEIFGKDVVITGQVSGNEKNIKSHWFEIVNPDRTTVSTYNLDSNELSYSFNLDTGKGSGIYKIRYVATDKAGNRSDDPKLSNSVVRTIIVDSTNPETTIEVSKVINGRFTVSGKATDESRLNRVYIQLVDRKTNQRCGGTTISLLSPNQKESEWSVNYDIRTLKITGASENCSIEGNYAAHVSVVDNLGNSGSTGWTENFFVADPIPKTTIEVSKVVNGRFTVSGKATDESRLNRVYVQLIDRKTNQRCGGTTINLLSPNQKESEWSVNYDIRTLKITGSLENCSIEGNYAAHVSVVDNFGNSSSAGWTENFFVETPNPETTIEVGNVINGKFTVSGEAFGYKRLNRVYVQLVDRKTNQRCGGTTINLLSPNQKESEWSVDYDIRELKITGSSENCSIEGNYAAHVSVVDERGKSGSAGWTENFFVADPIPKTTIEVSQVVNGKFTVSGKATDESRLNRAYVQLIDRKTNQRCGGTTINLLSPNQKESEWSVNYDIRTLKITGSLENCSIEGNYAAHVSIVDNFGNSSSAGWTENFFVEPLKDVTGPEFNHLSYITDTANLRWSHDASQTNPTSKAEVKFTLNDKSKIVEQKYIWSSKRIHNELKATPEKYELLNIDSTNENGYYSVKSPNNIEGHLILHLYAKDIHGNVTVWGGYDTYFIKEENVSSVSTSSELQVALADMNIKKINFLNSITSNQSVLINRPLIIHGGNNELLVARDLGEENSSKHLLNIISDNVVIRNLIVDSSSKAYGVQSYNAQNTSLKNITIKSSKGAGLTVNGSSVKADNLNTFNNAWGAVNVDPGKGVINSSLFELTGKGNLSEFSKIWSDGGFVTDTASVTVIANGYNRYPYGSNGQFWTNIEL